MDTYFNILPFLSAQCKLSNNVIKNGLRANHRISSSELLYFVKLTLCISTLSVLMSVLLAVLFVVNSYYISFLSIINVDEFCYYVNLRIKFLYPQLFEFC